MVEDASGHVFPFLRDRLFLSLYEACGHRTAALQDAQALCDTVIANLLRQQALSGGACPSSSIISAVLDVLQNFDTAAATHYEAYHVR